MKNIMFLFLFVASVACKTTDISPTNEIVGKWKLTSYAKKDMNNNIQNTIVPSDKVVFVSFSQSNKFEETYQNTKPIEYGFISGLGTYSVEGKNVKIFTYVMSSLSGMLFEITSIDKNKLILKNADFGEFIFEK
jgi:hypothetical protein